MPRREKLLHKLTNTATNAHCSSLQFIYSAGAWDSNSKRIAVATVTAGRPALAIFNADTANYRRYLMPVPFYTIAARVLRYGRYGSGEGDQRLFPLFLGCSSLVHGYDTNTFDPGGCVANATSECPRFDQLLGSRVLVGNLEFRFPLLRPFGVSQGMYGPIPAEVAFFTDGGVA